MTSLLHSLRHWVASQSVTHLAWECTAAAAVLILLLALPFIVRRLLRSGDRALPTVVVLVALLLVGLGTELYLDAGRRVGVAHAATGAPRFESAAIVSGRGRFLLGDYYRFQSAVTRSGRAVAGSFPQLIVPARWRDARTRGAFRANLVGLPTSFGQTVPRQRLGSPGAASMLAAWQTAVVSLKNGQSLANAALARSQSLRAGDIVGATIRGRIVYLSIRGVVPDGQLTGHAPVLVVPLATAQQITGLGGKVSAIQVVSGDTGAPTMNLIRHSASFLHKPRITPAGWHYAFRQKTAASDRKDKVLALAGVALVFLTCIGCMIVGRKGPRVE